MKNVLILLAVTSFYILPATAEESAETGYEFYNICKDESLTLQSFCIGYILASYDYLTGLEAACSPGNVVGGQMQKVFIKWADDHPEELHKGRMLSVGLALKDAFPCGAQSNK